MSSTGSYYTQALHGPFGLVTEKFGLTELALVFGGSRRSMSTSSAPDLIFPPALCEDDARRAAARAELNQLLGNTA